jgi:predicted membrane metal-binding protein
VIISPFFPIAIAYSIGIACAHCNPFAGYYFVVLSLAASLAYFLETNGHTKKLLFLIACAWAGSSRYLERTNSWYNNAHKISQKRITIKGLIVDTTETENNLLRITIACNRPLRLRGSTIFAYIKGKPFKTPFPGDFVTVSHASIAPPTNKDFCFYLIKEEIAATTFISSRSLFTRPGYSLKAKILKKRTALLESFGTKMNSETMLLFESLFMGKRTEIKNHPFALLFKQWGMSHYLARSGLHLAVFILIWQIFFSLLPIPWSLKQMLMLLISCTYLLFSWSSISILRAFSTFAFVRIFLFLKRPYDFFHLLCAIWILFLIINPTHLFFLDFQLTFLLTGALVWFSKFSRL